MIERERLFIYSTWIERHRYSHVVRRGFGLMVERAQESSHTHIHNTIVQQREQ